MKDSEASAGWLVGVGGKMLDRALDPTRDVKTEDTDITSVPVLGTAIVWTLILDSEMENTEVIVSI